MLSLELNEYLIFLSKYFSIDAEIIIQKSIEHSIILATDSPELVISKLKEAIGYQRRLIEPLSVAFTKSSSFDTLVSLITYKNFDNHVSLLVADRDNILKIIYFTQDKIEFKHPPGAVLKIDSCYVKDGSAKTSQPPKEIWFIDMPELFTIREYFLDNLPECIYDEEYTKKTNLVTIIGYFLTYKNNDKLFCFIYSRELQIRLIPHKLDEINTDLATKLVKITFCELEYGPDAYQLKMTEFSEFSELSKILFEIETEDFKKLVRFEYPSIRMSLSELTDKVVASTRIQVLSYEVVQDTWRFYGYDGSQAVCLIAFEEGFGRLLADHISDESFFLIDGIYKRGKKYYLRERPENVQILSHEEEDEISIPISRPDQLDEEKLAIIDILVTEITEKTFLSKENKTRKYEKIRGISYNTAISVNNYHKKYFQSFLVGKTYRLFFVKAKFFQGNIYFIMNDNTIVKTFSEE